MEIKNDGGQMNGIFSEIFDFLYFFKREKHDYESHF
jgi:hypothetical protein